ncbi:hypothetical protein AXG93_4509s1040 [Marchantia polymorpha subsp. ruderalis]|uniref:Kinesin motor domain-containing protein n=1 Tax=Marchantia polymorpha subsp. ruderalis TaxID=1480154 RepID=A0A176WKG5_MARPO|nr:hypothetical protein AXG93_4509s1040 [Marchantia polymorpha subsp. ruderalis]
MPTICIDENVYTVDEKIMACGQECSAKTYTMMGDDTVEGHGMVSYLEIYQERIRDLLVPFKVDPQAVRAEWQSCLDSGASRCGSVKSDRNWLESSDDTASYLSFGAGTLKSWKDKRAPSVCFDNPSTKEYLKLREHPVSGPYVKGLSWKDGYTWEDMEQISSALTYLLRDSLGGTDKTFLIAYLSPAEQDFQESVNTLRYAAKANHIQSSIISHPEKKKQLFVNMKKEAKIYRI